RAKSTPRNAKAAKQSSNSGRRPHASAWRPTHGATPATMTVGTTMHAAISVDAQALERMVRMLPIIGSIAALASWNSRMHPAKISSRRSLNTRQKLTCNSVAGRLGAFDIAHANARERQDRRRAKHGGQEEHSLTGDEGSARAHGS